MRFDGILTSVFIPLQMSSDTNLMKKHGEEWSLDAMPSTTGREPGWRGDHLFSFGDIFGRLD